MLRHRTSFHVIQKEAKHMCKRWLTAKHVQQAFQLPVAISPEDQLLLILSLMSRKPTILCGFCFCRLWACLHRCIRQIWRFSKDANLGLYVFFLCFHLNLNTFWRSPASCFSMFKQHLLHNSSCRWDNLRPADFCSEVFEGRFEFLGQVNRTPCHSDQRAA